MTIGIDPGIGGAIAVIDKNGYRSEEMPTMVTGTKNRLCINPLGVRDILRTMGKQTVYLERVHSMPQNGGAANFSFGDSYGCLRSICLVMGYPLVLVTPQEWKKFYKLGKDKEHARTKAIEMFPEENLNRKKDVDRAEALLIAYYGSQQ